jgi:hypothetical protein
LPANNKETNKATNVIIPSTQTIPKSLSSIEYVSTSDSTNKPVGLSFVAVSDKNGTECIKIMTSRHDRDYNRYVNGSRAFDLVRRKIIKDYENKEEE